MGLNSTPGGERIHIGFFGRRNAGKSSVVNAVTGQELSVVSPVKGTTTDPVYKSMELLPLGPVLIIDTPGFDDEGALGELRVKKTRQVLNKTDVAVLVVDSVEGLKPCDKEMIALFRKKEIPYIVAFNKIDLLRQFRDHADEKGTEGPGKEEGEGSEQGDGSLKGASGRTEFSGGETITVSALTGEGIHELKELIGRIVPQKDAGKRIAGDLVRPLDLVVLVVPIDSAAPKGRLILPQQQTIRDLLEAGAVPVVVRESELGEALRKLAEKPALVITDSQVFERVDAEVPEEIPLTSFSILMARYKGFLETAAEGISAVEGLGDGDRVLIAEGCTHHRQCEDIGTVKIPRWLGEYTGKKMVIETCSGTEFPEDLSEFAMVIHCGGCMLNEREMQYRMKCAQDQGVPFTNYGIAIAYMKGILKRSLSMFPQLEDFVG